MKRLVSVAFLLATATACLIRIGEPLEVGHPIYALLVDAPEGDCPLPPALTVVGWTMEEDASEVEGRTRFTSFGDGERAAAFLCDDGSETCSPLLWDDGTQVVYATLAVPPVRGDWEAEVALRGTCGPRCGAPTADSLTETCAGSVHVRAERVIAGMVNTARADEDSCAALSDPLPARTTPQELWVFNASSSQVEVLWLTEAGEQSTALILPASLGAIQAAVGDRFVIRDNADRDCLRVVDVEPDTRAVVLDKKGGGVL